MVACAADIRDRRPRPGLVSSQGVGASKGGVHLDAPTRSTVDDGLPVAVVGGLRYRGASEAVDGVFLLLADYLAQRYAPEAREEIEALARSFPEEDRRAFVALQVEMLRQKIEQLNRRVASLSVEDDPVRVDRREVERIHACINS
jgi:hypothetical protein